MRDEIQASVEREFPGAEVDVLLDGNRAMITVVSERFQGLGRVKQQQLVYAALDAFLKDGRLHAVTIKAATPD